MSTDLLYLQDTYRLEATAKLRIVNDDERGKYAILDETVFYPQGGGQPSDLGTITTPSTEVHVSFVRFIDGEVRHYGGFASDVTSLGETLRLEVDRQRRLRNAACHTAGHLVSNIAERLNSSLVAVKGYHFSEGSYVEFTGARPDDTDSFLDRVNEALSEAIRGDYSVEAALFDEEELKARCPHVPPNLPTDKPLRAVSIGEFPPIPCGGTHVRSLAELNSVRVTKIKSKKGNTRLSYECG